VVDLTFDAFDREGVSTDVVDAADRQQRRTRSDCRDHSRSGRRT
jgi:hypothetical protein